MVAVVADVVDVATRMLRATAAGSHNLISWSPFSIFMDLTGRPVIKSNGCHRLFVFPKKKCHFFISLFVSI